MKFPSFKRQPKLAKSDSAGEESRTSAKRSLFDQVVQVVLPIAVIGLFLWWFCTIPPTAPAPTLPANWTPGCPEVLAAWQAPPSNLLGDRVTLVARDLGADQWVWAVRNTNGRAFHAVRISDGELLASTPWPPGLMPLDTTQHIACSGKGTDEIPNVHLLDRHTLQEVGVQQFRSSDMPVVSGFTAFQSLIAMPGESWSGIVVYLPKSLIDKDGKIQSRSSGSTAHLYWFLADPDGTITRFRRLPHAANAWKPVPVDAPTMLEGWSLVGMELMHNFTLDLRTGEELMSRDADMPTPVAAPARSLSERRLSPIPYARRPFKSMRQERLRTPRLEAEMSIFHPFQPESPPPDTPWHRYLRYEIASLRFQAWRMTHDPPELQDHAARSLTVDGVTLHPGGESADGSIAIAGELSDAIRYEILTAYRERYSPERPQTDDAQQIRFGSVGLMLQHRDCETNLRALPGGGYLILQVLREAPKAIGQQDGLLRIGKLSGDGAKLNWYGCVSLKTLPEEQHWLIDPDNFQIEIAEDRMFMSVSGDGQRMRLNRPLPRIVSWITLPLPTELTDLPEGLLP